MNSNLQSLILEASNSIYSICKKTPLKYSKDLSELTGVNIYLKKEYKQHTGSFKLRGAANKLLKIYENIKDNPSIQSHNIEIVTASTGNHGIAVTYACKAINELKQNKTTKIKCIVYSPNNVDASKSSLIQKNKAELIKISTNNSIDAELTAKIIAQNTQSTYISPYNDYDIIAGQGTLGLEILEDMENNCDAVFVSVGGGGLISGIAEYVRNINPDCKIVGCQPYNSRVIYESLKSRKILQDVPELETFSDATAGGVEQDSVTFPVIQRHVNDFVLASEKEISLAFCMLLESEKIAVEGSAALTLACLMKEKEKWQGKNVVLVLCGANVSLKKISSMIEYSTNL